MALKIEKMKELMKVDLKSLKKGKSNNERKSNIEKRVKESNKKVIAFDIGSKKTKIVVGKYNKGNLEVERLISASTPHECIKQGVITNLPTLANFIEQKLSNEKIKIKEVICTNNSTEILNREIVIPKVKEDEIETVVKFEIQQYLPLNMNDYIIQSQVLDDIEVEGQAKFRTLVFTYPEKMAQSYYKLFTDVNLKPTALDITYNSINKLANRCSKINNVEYNIQDTNAFIDMGANNLNVQIYKKGKLEFTRIIKSGGSNIDIMLSKILQVSVSEAEKEKIERGTVALNPENAVDDIVTIVVEEWINELQRIIQFYKSNKLGNNIDKIYLYGGSSNLNGIEIYMTNRLNINVETIEKVENLKTSNSLSNEKISEYLNAIGAIIRL